MSATTARRTFDVALDGRLHAFLTDGEMLYEVVAVRGLPARLGEKPEGHAALKLADVSLPLPVDRMEELDAAAWIPLAEVEVLEVVLGKRHSSG